jgi:hypothetical protein
LILTLAKEVKAQQLVGGDKDHERYKLMELAEKELERDSLLAKKDKNYPAIFRQQEYIEQMAALQEEEEALLEQIEVV